MDFFDVYALITLLTFYTLLLSKIFLLHKKDKNAIHLAKGKKGFARNLERSYVLGLFILSYLVIQSAFSLPFIFIGELIVVKSHWLLDLLGFLFLTFSIILFSLALKSFKDAFSIGINMHADHRLITTGIFKYTRNPTYISLFFLFLGYTLLYMNFFFLGSLVFMGFTLNYQIKKEERLLKQVFKDEYIHYQKQTRKFF